MLKQIRRLEGKLERLKLMYVEGYIDASEFRAEYTAVHGELESARSCLGPLEFNVDEVLERLEHLGAMLTSGSPEQQKHAVELLIERIDVGQDGEIVSILPHEWCMTWYAPTGRRAHRSPNCPGAHGDGVISPTTPAA